MNGAQHTDRERALRQRRQRISHLFTASLYVVAFGTISILATLLIDICASGISWVSLDFLNSFPSRFPARAGIKSALYGTVWLITFTTLISLPVGVGASLYLEEFARSNRLNKLIQLNIANLAGVPSIVYGMLGLVIFVRTFGFGRSVLSGALTLSLLILPVIIIASQEAIRAVPRSLRLAALALGATRWETTRDHVLPAAMPGIMTSLILALSRAVGETAPLIMIGALTYVAFIPNGPLDGFTALPIQIFNWTSRPQHDFHALAAAGIIVLLVVLFSMNFTAIVIRHRFQKRLKW